MMFDRFAVLLSVGLILPSPEDGVLFARAMVASPHPFEEPNGATGTSSGPMYLIGDEHISYVEDGAGYTVCEEKMGNGGGGGKRKGKARANFFYCDLDEATGDLVPDRRAAVGRDNPRIMGKSKHRRASREAERRRCGDNCPENWKTEDERDFEGRGNGGGNGNGGRGNGGREQVGRGRGRSESLRRLGAPLVRANESRRNLVIKTGVLKNLVVIFKFYDHDSRPVPSQADINVLMNGDTATNSLIPTGSVKDVFDENSFNQLDLQSTVAAWVTLDATYTETYCADGDSGSAVTHQCLGNALTKVEEAGIDFSQFDEDNDGYIDGITFLHSGYAAETGGNDMYGTARADRIWSHKWSLWSLPGGNWQSDEGVKVSEYHISPAVWGTSGSNIGRIGVIAHETGHFLGLPDLYDYSSGQGLGSWSLMANSWGFDGSQYYPPQLDPWCKEQLGWATPILLSAYQSGLTLPPSYSSSVDQYYKIEDGYASNEYLIIEYRKKIGFDLKIPQEGFVIYHIDDGGQHNNPGNPSQSGWPTNGNHYRVAVLQADGDYDLERGIGRGDGEDVFHIGGVKRLTTGTDGGGPNYPNTDSYQGGTITETSHVIDVTSTGGQDGTFNFDSFACQLDSECDDSNDCTTDTCETDGSCTSVVALDQPCDDADECTDNDKCTADAKCVGTLRLQDAQCQMVSLETTFQANNGAVGNSFKIKALVELTVKRFDVHTSSTSSSHNVKVYTKPGGQFGSMDSGAGWTLIYDGNVVAKGTGTPTELPNFNTAVNVAASSEQSFHVVTDGIQYTSGNAEGNKFSENPGVLEFYEGKGCGGLWNCGYSPRVWNGNIHYTTIAAAPTEAPVPAPTEAPVPAPTEAPVPAPTEAPVPAPTDAPVPAPTEAPVPAPTEAPVQAPTEAPVPAPTEAPVPAPTEAPVPAPTDAPIPAPTEEPVPDPTEAPVPAPTEAPVPAPTEAPVPAPTEAPVPAPTEAPVPAPTEAPVPAPTEAPVPAPTEAPVPAPTEAPVPAPTEAPVPAPTEAPVPAPTEAPVPAPTDAPVPAPTEPVVTSSPTSTPSSSPTSAPSKAPATASPTRPDGFEASLVTNEWCTHSGGQAGVMFDIEAKRTVTITSFDFMTKNPGLLGAEIWTKAGSYVGFKSNPSAWTKIADIEEMQGLPWQTWPRTSSPMGPGIISQGIEAGETRAFYVTQKGTTGGSMVYEPTGIEGEVFNENDQIKQFVGIGGYHGFGHMWSPRKFNGVVRYRTGTDAPTYSPAPTISMAPSSAPTSSPSSNPSISMAPTTIGPYSTPTESCSTCYIKDGHMFDVHADKEITVTQVKFRTFGGSGDLTVKVWTKVGGRTGSEYAEAEWTPVGTHIFPKPSGFCLLYTVPAVDMIPVHIPAGMTQSFYVTLEGGNGDVCYKKVDTTTGTSYQTDQVSLDKYGAAMNYKFVSRTNNRQFLGGVVYWLGSNTGGGASMPSAEASETEIEMSVGAGGTIVDGDEEEGDEEQEPEYATNGADDVCFGKNEPCSSTSQCCAGYCSGAQVCEDYIM